MGNAQGGGPESFRSEHVTSAGYYTRHLQSGSSGSGSGCGAHHGVVAHTAEGHSWLIHNPGPSGITVVTPASDMSKAWSKDHDIPVLGEKTMQEVYNAASGRTTHGLTHYVTSGTCIGSAHAAEKALETSPEMAAEEMRLKEVMMNRY